MKPSCKGSLVEVSQEESRTCKRVMGKAGTVVIEDSGSQPCARGICVISVPEVIPLKVVLENSDEGGLLLSGHHKEK